MDPDDLDLMVAAQQEKAASQQPPVPGVTFTTPATAAPSSEPEDDLDRIVADKAAQQAPPPPGVTFNQSSSTPSPSPPDDDLDRMVAANQARSAASSQTLPTTTQSDPLYSTVTPGDSFLQGVVSGVPIIGPALLSGAEKAAAYARSVTNGTSYDEELAHQQFLQAARTHDDPGSEMAGNLTGGALTMGAAGATDAGGAALGMSGANLASRIAAGTASGTAIGAADAAARSGGDLGAVERGASLGALTGGGAPVVGAGLGALASRAGNAINYFRPAAQAQNAIANDVATSGANIADLQARMAANPRLAPMDVNNVLQSRAMGLAGTMEGDSRSTMMDAYNGRTAGAGQAVNDAYDAAMGPTPNVPALLQGMQQTARQNAQQGFGAALQNAGPVDVTPVINDIDQRLYPGGTPNPDQMTQLGHGPTEETLLRVRNSLTNGDAQVTDPNRLHQIQSALRRDSDTLSSSANGQDRITAQALGSVRQNLVTQIDQAAGGAYRPAQRQFADDMAIRDGFDRGMNVFRNRSGPAGIDDRPEVLQNWLNNASPGETQAAVQGARVAADNLIRTTRFSARNGANLPDVPANFDKLQALLGPDEASNLQRSLQDEQAIGRTNNMMFQNSMTQPRTAAAQSVAVRPITPFSYGHMSLPVMAEVAGLGHRTAAAGLATGLLTGGARTAVSAVGRAADIARNQAMARMLISSGPEGQAVMNGIAQRVAAAGQPGFLPTTLDATAHALIHGSTPYRNMQLAPPTGGHP